MYLPKFKQSQAKYTSGGEYFVVATGEEYRGFYVQTSKGILYSGKTVQRGVSQELREYIDPETTFDRPVPEKYDNIRKDSEGLELKVTRSLPKHIPQRNDLQPYILRFFAKSKVTGVILEISQETFLELESQSTLYHYPSYDITYLKWYTTYPVEDTTIGTYIQKGSKSRNLEEILKTEKALPGISQYLTDPAELIL